MVVIVTFPSATPITFPSAFTVAIELLLLVQEIVRVGVGVTLFICVVNVVFFPIPRVFGAFVIFMLGTLGSISPQVKIPS